ncbi:glyoxalase superfamily protein [Streptomyces noursei]|nr:bleomycin resistance protein [Streptomyces noursei ATCC 11455]MCZ0992729.1 glyoxalase superfamily protein [Streptomyces noursei]
MSDIKETGGTKGGDGTQSGEVVVRRAVPIFRIFDVAKAHEFYVDYLGCTLDWEHRFAPGMPLYTQVSRSGLVLHLSEHHGDATPGSTVYVELTGVRALHAELTAKDYPYLRPGLEEDEFGTCLTLTDPFGNRLRFNEPLPEGRQG